jgi:hypothetical protein
LPLQRYTDFVVAARADWSSLHSLASKNDLQLPALQLNDLQLAALQNSAAEKAGHHDIE